MSHALIIGVNDYTNGWPKLPSVRRDVEEVKAVLEAQRFNVLVKMDPDKNQKILLVQQEQIKFQTPIN